MLINIKSINKCAFCRYWYDPTNETIKPVNPRMNIWEYKDSDRRICTKKNIKMIGSAFCSKYECKLDIN